MWKKHIEEILQDCDEFVRAVILRVLSIEQEHISMNKPRVNELINALVENIAEESLKREEVG